MSKICKKCLVDKPLNEYNKGNDPKDGCKYECKDCQRIINKKYRDNNKERYKDWVKKNPDKVKQKAKSFRDKTKSLNDDDKVIIKNKRQIYYKNNKEKILAQVKKYSSLNQDKIKQKFVRYKETGKTKEYRDKNKHITAWRNLLNNSLKRLGQIKENKTNKLLGYSALELKQHIESLFTEGMSWDNYGDWHIDHIKPVVSFQKDTTPNIVNALSNLRPMWSTTREINGIVYEGNLNRPKY